MWARAPTHATQSQLIRTIPIVHPGVAQLPICEVEVLSIEGAARPPQNGARHGRHGLRTVAPVHCDDGAGSYGCRAVEYGHLRLGLHIEARAAERDRARSPTTVLNRMELRAACRCDGFR